MEWFKESKYFEYLKNLIMKELEEEIDKAIEEHKKSLKQKDE